jgi:4-hydroxyphenylpyruvate dioxygenase-like putative hemolysin
MHLVDRQIDLPGIPDIPSAVARVVRRAAGLAACAVDHVALCVEAGNFDRYVERARQQLPGSRFSEYSIGDLQDGMRIAEVRDRDAGVHIVLAAPTGDRGQLAEFLAVTGAEGLQHVAFAVPDAAAAVAELSAQGLCFVGGAVDPARAIVEVREGDSWLRQAFTEPLFGEFFIEVVERRGIVEMRPENIRSLYDMKSEASAAVPA